MTARRPRLPLPATLAKATLVAICLLPGPTPAHADDFSACIGAIGNVILAGPESALELLENPATLPCLAYVDDPVFDAVVTGLMALKEKGTFSTVDQCKALPAATMAQIASDAGVLESAVPWDCACRVAIVGLDALKKAINATGNVVNKCGKLADDAYCGIVDDNDEDCSNVNPPTPPMPKQDDACRHPEPGFCTCDLTPHKECKWDHCVIDKMQHSRHCWMDNSNYWSWEYELENPDNPPPPPPIPDQWNPKTNLCTNCITHQTYKPLSCTPAVDPKQFSCGYGSQCGVNQAWLAWYNGNPWKPHGPLGPWSWESWSKCVSCDTVINGVPIGDGVCGCRNGYQPSYETGLSGKKTLLTCNCPAPMKEGRFIGPQLECRCPIFGQVPRTIGGKLMCACPANQELENGLCRPCTSKERYDPQTLKCIPWQGKPYEVAPPVPPGGRFLPPGPPPGRPRGVTPTPQRPGPGGMRQPPPARPGPGLFRRFPMQRGQ